MGDVSILIVASWFSGILGFLAGCAIQNAWWEKRCISQGFARYNETTGKWEWK